MKKLNSKMKSFFKKTGIGAKENNECNESTIDFQQQTFIKQKRDSVNSNTSYLKLPTLKKQKGKNNKEE
jgi:hypothetical protein